MGYIVKLSDLPDKLDSIEPILDKIVEGDCLKLMRRMPDKCVDTAITDIPFNVGWNYGGTYNDSLPDSEYSALCASWFLAMGRLAKRMIVKCPTKNLHLVLPAFPYRWMLVQHSPNTTGRGYTILNLFTLYLVSDGDGKKPITDFFVNTNNIIETNHPAEMPVAPITRIITDWVDELGVILDPFVGSGTTAVAAKKLGRHFIGCEISLEYCKIAERRLLEIDAQPELFPKNKAEQLELK